MRLYGWTYQEYLEQPAYLIDLALEKLGIDRTKQAV